MSHTLQGLTEMLLNAAKKSGADNADAMAVQGQSLSIDVRGGQLEQAERAEGTDIGLRVLIGLPQQAIATMQYTSPPATALPAATHALVARYLA